MTTTDPSKENVCTCQTVSDNYSDHRHESTRGPDCPIYTIGRAARIAREAPSSKERVYTGCSDVRGHRWVREVSQHYATRGQETPEYCDHCGVLWSNVMPAVETSAPTAVFPTRWRSVEDSMPVEGEHVLVWWPYWHTCAWVGTWDGHEWHSEHALSPEGGGPTHWMPLPGFPDSAQETSPEEPARELSPSEAASFDKTLARSPRLKSPGVRIETITHEDGSKTEMHMLGDLLPDEPAKASAPTDCDCGTFCHASRGGQVLPLGARCRRTSEKASEPQMAMLPNDRHPGPGCSCRDCLRQWPDVHGYHG